MEILIFQIGDHHYGIDADRVMEIIDPVPVTPLPFMPSEVEGLIHLAGRIITQICAGRRLQQEETDSPRGGVVMILSTANGLCACRVTKVLTKTGVAADSISSAQVAECPGEEALLTGEFHWQDAIVLLLNPDLLLRPMVISTEEDAGAELVSEQEEGGLQREVSAHVEQFSCVTFACNNELFALRFEDIAEVIENGALTPLPGAPPELPGMVLLRGEPLPLLSLQSILFGGVSAPTPFTLVVFLNDCRVGLQVERVVGIRRFACDALRPLPEEQSLLEGFVTTPDEALVLLLRFSALSAPDRFDAWRPWLIAVGTGSAEDRRHNGAAVAKKKMLLFRLGTENLALPLEAVDRVEEYFTPTETPEDVSSEISGLIQVQGNIVPVCALGRLMGMASDGHPTAYIIVADGGKRCAVAVDKIERLVALDESAIERTYSGQNRLMAGIAKYNGLLVSLLNYERLTS